MRRAKLMQCDRNHACFGAGNLAGNLACKTRFRRLSRGLAAPQRGKPQTTDFARLSLWEDPRTGLSLGGRPYPVRLQPITLSQPGEALHPFPQSQRRDGGMLARVDAEPHLYKAHWSIGYDGDGADWQNEIRDPR